MFRQEDTESTRFVIWFSSILRWVLGSIFIVLGCFYSGDGGLWALMLFGLAFIITGFIRPKRCLDDDCKM